MIGLAVWLAFALACIALVIVPGPTVTVIVANSLRHGARAGLLNVAGTQVGLAGMVVVLAVGLSAVVEALGWAFDWLRLAGAAYLVWLGVKLWRAGGTLDATPRTDRASSLKMLGHAWLVTALNPKGLTFFIAFLPQFIDPKLPLLPQVGVFGATFLVLAFANAFTYALIASRARSVVRNPRAIGIFNKAGGSLLIGAGVAAVALRAGQA
jgi:threonine/homoserine/homoserine lactone efflux protein